MGYLKKFQSASHRLTVLLSDVHQLYIKALAYHWNVESARFQQLHALFEEIYEQLAGDMDQLAERIRKLGEFAPWSVEQMSRSARLEQSQAVLNADEMIDTLAANFESLLVWLREDIEFATQSGDPGTADLLTSILRRYEKQVWMLRSHLVKTEEKIP